MGEPLQHNQDAPFQKAGPRGEVPSSLFEHVTWATHRLDLFARMALPFAARRGLAESIRIFWRCSDAGARGAALAAAQLASVEGHVSDCDCDDCAARDAAADARTGSDAEVGDDAGVRVDSGDDDLSGVDSGDGGRCSDDAGGDLDHWVEGEGVEDRSGVSDESEVVEADCLGIGDGSDVDRPEFGSGLGWTL